MGKCVWCEQPGKLKIKKLYEKQIPTFLELKKKINIQLFINSYIKNKKEQPTHFACSFIEVALSLIVDRCFFK